jgi:hypothetical protein
VVRGDGSLYGGLDGGEADAFLFQPHALAEGAGDQVAVHGGFAGIEQVQQDTGRGRLGYPLVPVRQQRAAVHQHRADVRQPLPEAAEDGEAVGVYVAPVDDV